MKDCYEANTYNTIKPDQECATKRIPVCPSTWEAIRGLRKPGQTFDDVIRNLVREENRRRLYDETHRIIKEDDFIPLKETG